MLSTGNHNGLHLHLAVLRNLTYYFYSFIYKIAIFICFYRPTPARFTLPFCDVSTRLNTTYLMIKRCLELRVVIEMYVPSDDKLSLTSITNNKWMKLNSVGNILEPLYGATKYLSQSNYPALGSTLFIYGVLLKVSLLNEIQIY